jgi:glucose repression mediator protein
MLIPGPGSLTELMGDLDGAMNAYEQATRHNPTSIAAMTAIACILRTKEQFPKAIEFLHHILRLDAGNGETWGSLGASLSSAICCHDRTNRCFRPL